MAPFRIDFYQPIIFPTSYKISAKLKTKKIYSLDDFFDKLSRPQHFFPISFRPVFNIADSAISIGVAIMVIFQKKVLKELE